jgi:hypothetical protein
LKKVLFFVILVLFCANISAQEYVFGKIISEDAREISEVTIINISNQQTTVSNSDGNFMIFAKLGDEIRFSKDGYYRVSKNINSENISKSFLITLAKIPFDIEEVEIKYKITGDLKKDAAHFGKSKKIVKLEEDLGTYIKQKSSYNVIAPKKGEFSQPSGLESHTLRY